MLWRFGHLPGCPDPERGSRCIEEEARSDNLTVGVGVAGLTISLGNQIIWFRSEGERDEGTVLRRTSS